MAETIINGNDFIIAYDICSANGFIIDIGIIENHEALLWELNWIFICKKKVWIRFGDQGDVQL